MARVMHIRDEIEGISGAFEGIAFDRYRTNYLLQRGAERALLIISEAAKAIPHDLLDRYPDVDWRAVIQLGNVLRHECPTIDSTVIWEIVTQKLPQMRPVVDQMIRDLSA